MGFLDRYVNNQVDGSMGPYSLTEEDKKKLKKRGLMTLGATLLATPTGQGGIGQAFGKGLLNANEALQSGGQDMMKQKYQSDQMARYKADQEKQRLIDGLAAKHRKLDGTVDMEAFQNDYMSIVPEKFIQTGNDNAELAMWNNLTNGLTPEEKARARRIKLKLEGGESSAAIQYKPVVQPDGSVRYMAFDPNNPNAQVPNMGGVGQPSMAPPPPKPVLAKEAQDTLNNIAMTPDFQSLSKVDQAKVADYISNGDFTFQIKNGQLVNGQSAGATLPSGITPDEQARRVAQAQADVELANKPNIAAATLTAEANAKNKVEKSQLYPVLRENAISLQEAIDGLNSGQYSTGMENALIPDFAQSSDNQYLITSLNRQILDLAEQMKGSLSDKDVAFLKSSGANMNFTEEANKQILQKKLDVLIRNMGRIKAMEQGRAATQSGGSAAPSNVIRYDAQGNRIQ